MHIIKVGINYRTAPVDIREKLAFSEDAVDGAMIHLNLQKSILENVIISTCNRTEIYVVADQLHTGRYYIKQFLSDWFEIDKESFMPYLAIEENNQAIEHLFRVASGLDSMILGETQILGQVRDAFLIAQKARTTGTIFNELFKQAITFAKRAHKETSIGEHAVSISYAAVQLAKATFDGSIQDKQIVVLGAGKMGTLSLKNLNSAGAKKLSIVNRTFEKAEMLAKEADALPVPFEQLEELLEKADLLISSTGASDMVLRMNEVQEILAKRSNQSELVMIDIAVPRDIDSGVAGLDGVKLFDIDNLQDIVDENLESRKEAATQIEGLLKEEIEVFNEWLATLGVVPVISALREKALAIQAETMKSIERKMPDLTSREKKVLNKHTKSIINQLLKEPIKQAKELVNNDNPEEALALFMSIFGIDEAVKEDLICQKQDEKNPAAFETGSSGILAFSLADKIMSR